MHRANCCPGSPDVGKKSCDICFKLGIKAQTIDGPLTTDPGELMRYI